jgi:hypothetical protein
MEYTFAMHTYGNSETLSIVRLEFCVRLNHIVYTMDFAKIVRAAAQEHVFLPIELTFMAKNTKGGHVVIAAGENKGVRGVLANLAVQRAMSAGDWSNGMPCIATDHDPCPSYVMEPVEEGMADLEDRIGGRARLEEVMCVANAHCVELNLREAGMYRAALASPSAVSAQVSRDIVLHLSNNAYPVSDVWVETGSGTTADSHATGFQKGLPDIHTPMLPDPYGVKWSDVDLFPLDHYEKTSLRARVKLGQTPVSLLALETFVDPMVPSVAPAFLTIPPVRHITASAGEISVDVPVTIEGVEGKVRVWLGCNSGKLRACRVDLLDNEEPPTVTDSVVLLRSSAGDGAVMPADDTDDDNPWRAIGLSAATRVDSEINAAIQNINTGSNGRDDGFYSTVSDGGMHVVDLIKKYGPRPSSAVELVSLEPAIRYTNGGAKVFGRKIPRVVIRHARLVTGRDSSHSKQKQQTLEAAAMKSIGTYRQKLATANTALVGMEDEKTIVRRAIEMASPPTKGWLGRSAGGGESGVAELALCDARLRLHWSGAGVTPSEAMVKEAANACARASIASAPRRAAELDIYPPRNADLCDPLDDGDDANLLWRWMSGSSYTAMDSLLYASPPWPADYITAWANKMLPLKDSDVPAMTEALSVFSSVIARFSGTPWAQAHTHDNGVPVEDMLKSKGEKTSAETATQAVKTLPARFVWLAAVWVTGANEIGKVERAIVSGAADVFLRNVTATILPVRGGDSMPYDQLGCTVLAAASLGILRIQQKQKQKQKQQLGVSLFGNDDDSEDDDAQPSLPQFTIVMGLPIPLSSATCTSLCGIWSKHDAADKWRVKVWKSLDMDGDPNGLVPEIKGLSLVSKAVQAGLVVSEEQTGSDTDDAESPLGKAAIAFGAIAGQTKVVRFFLNASAEAIRNYVTLSMFPGMDRCELVARMWILHVRAADDTVAHFQLNPIALALIIDVVFLLALCRLVETETAAAIEVRTKALGDAEEYSVRNGAGVSNPPMMYCAVFPALYGFFRDPMMSRLSETGRREARESTVLIGMLAAAICRRTATLAQRKAIDSKPAKADISTNFVSTDLQMFVGGSLYLSGELKACNMQIARDAYIGGNQSIMVGDVEIGDLVMEASLWAAGRGAHTLRPCDAWWTVSRAIAVARASVPWMVRAAVNGMEDRPDVAVYWDSAAGDTKALLVSTKTTPAPLVVPVQLVYSPSPFYRH